MKIVIIGAGKIGSTIIKQISHEDHSIVVVDADSKVIEKIVNTHDVMGVCGNGLNIEILKSAGVDKADLVICTTESDEANMISCQLAKKLGAKETAARVRDYEYTSQGSLLMETLGISHLFNPEREASREIIRIVNFPEALKVEDFAQGRAMMVELLIKESSPLDGLKIHELTHKFNTPFLVGALKRKDKVFIPNGAFEILSGDRIHLIADTVNLRNLLNKLGYISDKIKEILIIGGGRITIYFATELLNRGVDVKIIERDMEKCEELSQILKKATIICGDGTDLQILEEEGLSQSDVVISLTGNDEENIIISMYANKQNVKKVITKVNKQSFYDLLESVKMASVISPQEAAANHMISYIRALSNAKGNNIKTLYRIVNDEVEAIEFSVSSSSKLLNLKLMDIKLKSSILIGGIIRNNSFILPKGDTIIEENDSVIVVAKEILQDLDDILE